MPKQNWEALFKGREAAFKEADKAIQDLELQVRVRDRKLQILVEANAALKGKVRGYERRDRELAREIHKQEKAEARD